LIFLGTALALALALAACEGGPADEVAAIRSAITQERLGGVAEVVARRYGDPEIARVSYATGLFAGGGGCTAAMIGPNVMMTAAHCGPRASETMTFRTYRNGSTTSSDAETFSCTWLGQTFSETDLSLHFCSANAAGENPGDKYGYLDFDPSAPTVGQRVYSVWWNPIGSQTSDARLYSEGKVTGTSYAGWFTPGGDPGQAIGIESDVWSAPGASGSVQINPLNHRALIGPTSLVQQPEGAWRAALSLRDYLRSAAIADTTKLNTTQLQAMNLTASAYVGAVDKDSNQLFDLHEDVERAHGEGGQAYRWLGFESERRNALWNRAVGVSFSASGGWAHIDHSQAESSAFNAMTNAEIPIKPYVTYRFSISTWISWAGTGATLQVALRSKLSTVASASIMAGVTQGSGWQRRTVTLYTTTPNTYLAITTNGSIDAFLSEPVLVENGSGIDFDSHDQRLAWRNANTGARAQITPDGTTTGTPDWAGVAARDTRYARGSDWSLSNRRLGLVAGRSYQICLQTRQATAAPGTNWGLARVLDGTTELLRTSFRPITSWNSTCLPTFRATTADVTVQFGVDADPVPTGFETWVLPRYLVDLITVREV
jgi:hypothetical protein